MKQRVLLVCSVWLSVSFLPFSMRPARGSSELTDIPIERLMDIEVTSVSKKEEYLSKAAAAVFVVTQEDIRRSGVTNIPDALRMVPGVQVHRIDSNKWAVSVRGLTGRFTNKLLVLMDGRSVYTPLFSGVFWEVQDTLMEDIDRIEVIRGPGATLWGANAVNGVINIITKKSQDTHGGLVSVGGGTEERGFGGARYGGQAGEGFHYRVYAKYFNRDEGFGGPDDWWMARTGVRTDWEIRDEDLLTVQGDFYDGNTGWRLMLPSLLPPFTTTADLDAEFTGGNVLSRWTHTFHEKSDLALQAYYDANRFDAAGFKSLLHTVDLDFQHRFPWGERQDILWGAGYRLITDSITSIREATFTPGAKTTHLFSGFIQDDITLVRDRLRLTLGSKFERNSYSGFEVQPSGRLTWTPNDRHTVWAAISRAVRLPSRSFDDIRLSLAAIPDPISGTPIEVVLFGNRNFKPEAILASEIGYRVDATPRLNFDFALFLNRYTDLQTVEPGTPFFEPAPVPHVVAPQNIANNMDGFIYGAEVAVHWRPFDWWNLTGAYSFLDIQLTLDPGSADVLLSTYENESPAQQFSLRSTMDLPWKLQFDTWLRYTDGLPSFNIGRYLALDARLGWKPLKNLEISVVGQNLLDDRHLEFVPAFINTQPTEIERSVYGKLTWTF